MVKEIKKIRNAIKFIRSKPLALIRLHTWSAARVPFQMELRAWENSLGVFAPKQPPSEFTRVLDRGLTKLLIFFLVAISRSHVNPIFNTEIATRKYRIFHLQKNSKKSFFSEINEENPNFVTYNSSLLYIRTVSFNAKSSAGAPRCLKLAPASCGMVIMRSSETAENRKWAKNFSSRLKFFFRHIDYSASDWARSRVLTYPHSNDLWRWINSPPFRRFYVSCQKDILKIFQRIQSSNFPCFLVRDNCIFRWLGTRIILPSNTSPVIHNRRRSRNRKCFLFDSTSFRPAAEPRDSWVSRFHRAGRNWFVERLDLF